MEVLKAYRMYGDVSLPVKSTPGSACFDVFAYFGVKEVHVKVWNDQNVAIQYMAHQDLPTDKVHLTLRPGDRALIPTGLILDIPEGYSVRTHPRSGLAIKQGIALANCEGVIDWDYVEQLYVPVINFTNTAVVINHGDRIAQLEMVRVLDQELAVALNAPAKKTSRNGGFGSTGVSL